MAKEFKNYIAGQWVIAHDGNSFVQRNPAKLDEITGIWPAGTREEARDAIEAARAAYSGWRRLTVFKRAEYLKQALQLMIERREELAETITLENGKTIRESLAETDSAIREMEYQIQEGLRLCGQTAPSAHAGVFVYSQRVPLGVVSVISPWNFPLNVPGRKITPALVAGNTCVFKPSSLTPQVGLKFTELLVDAGLPAGVLNFVTGSGAEVGAEVVNNPVVKAISFTGSTEAGRKINEQAARTMARTQLEMGGKNPVIVLEDADLADAAKSVVTAAFSCAGQWCTSTSRVIVVREIADRFREAILRETGQIVTGDGRSSQTTMGPVCGEDQLKSILRYIDIGQKEGARLILGGNQIKDPDFDRGCFIQPTIFDRVTPEMAIAREEIFGPVLSLIEVRDFAEAIAVANAIDFGLASSIYTNDIRRAFTYLEESEVGLAHVNLMTAMKEPQMSFGGIKDSGFGIPEAGKTGIEFFTDHKVAYIKYR